MIFPIFNGIFSICKGMVCTARFLHFKYRIGSIAIEILATNNKIFAGTDSSDSNWKVVALHVRCTELQPKKQLNSRPTMLKIIY